MRKSVIGASVATVALFGAGYAAGQMLGISTSSAASSVSSLPRMTGHMNWGPLDRPGDHFAAGPHVYGKVTAVNGDSITIAPQTGGDGNDSTVTTVIVTGSTQYFSGGGAAGSKSAIKVGTFISARGTATLDGKTLTATNVSIGADKGGRFGHFAVGAPHADGTVSTVNGDTITVSPDADHMGNGNTPVTTIVVTSATTYDTGWGGSAATTKDAVKTGAHIMATGSLSSDGKTLTATHVSVFSGHEPDGGHGSNDGNNTSGNDA